MQQGHLYLYTSKMNLQQMGYIILWRNGAYKLRTL